MHILIALLINLVLYLSGIDAGQPHIAEVHNIIEG